MNNTIAHYFNPLHLFCRLRDWGFKKERAKTLAEFYEDVFFNKRKEKELNQFINELAAKIKELKSRKNPNEKKIALLEKMLVNKLVERQERR